MEPTTLPAPQYLVPSEDPTVILDTATGHTYRLVRDPDRRAPAERLTDDDPELRNLTKFAAAGLNMAARALFLFGGDLPKV